MQRRHVLESRMTQLIVVSDGAWPRANSSATNSRMPGNATRGSPWTNGHNGAKYLSGVLSYSITAHMRRVCASS